MTPEEKIEQAAEEYANYVVQEHTPTEWSHEEMKSLLRANFEGVVKSKAAEEYHTKGVYSEEEVKKMCEDSWMTSSYDRVSEKESELHFLKWFNQNKKK